MIASVLISRPVQIIAQWLLEIAIVEPRSKLIVVTSFAWGFISKGRG